MKIGLITSFYDEREKGNEYYLAKELSKNHDVCIYVSEFSLPRYGKIERINNGSSLKNVQVKRLKSFGLYNKGMIFLKGLKKEIERDDLDVIHVQEWFFPMTWQLKSKKLILTQRRETFDFSLKILYWLFGKKSMERSLGLTCLTTQAKESLPEEVRERFKVIPNGVDTSLFFPQRIRKRGFQVLYVGRLDYEKGVDVLIEACKQIDCELKIIGSGKEEENLKKNSGEKVDFLGKKRQEELSEYYSNADVLVVPSRREPFGFVTLEALSCGTPVIGTNIGGMRDVINEKTGLKFDGSVNGLIEALNKIKGTKFDTRKEVLEKYDWKKIAERYLEVYEKKESSHLENKS